MFHINERKQGLSAAIFGLWRNWAIAIGFIAILSFVSPLIRQTWLAPVCLVLYFALQGVRSVMKNQEVPVCSRLYQEVSTILLVVTLVVAFRTLVTGADGAFELTGQPVSRHTPIMGILVSAPVMAIVAAVYLMKRTEPLVCQLCHIRYGNVIENGFIGKLYEREWRYQTKLLMFLALAVGVIDWVYYLVMYININLNRADYFFFLWLPFVAYIASLIYLGWRYYSLWMYYCHNDETKLVSDPSSTTIRYIVICDDRILVDIRQTKANYENGQIVKRFDTPARYSLPYTERFDVGRAIQIFRQSTGIRDFEVRPLYESPDNVTYRNIFHFFAFLKSPREIVDSKLHGEWMSLGELRQLIAMKLISVDLSSELTRIYRIAMAWKTYDRDGRRLYKIKHYRPTFRLKDLKAWEVDYNDGHWLDVGKNNEDSHFYRLRRFFRAVDRKVRRLTPILS